MSWLPAKSGTAAVYDPGVHLDSGLPNAYARPFENRAVVAVLVAVLVPSSGRSQTRVNHRRADS
jgi:hypothetical protein